MAALSDVCAEWRQLASCEIDDEITELDAARLQRHIGECPACARWVRGVRAATDDLRSARRGPTGRALDLFAARRRLVGMSSVAATVAATAAFALVGLTQWQVSSQESAGASRLAAAAASASPRSAWVAGHRVLFAAHAPKVLPPRHVTLVTGLS